MATTQTTSITADQIDRCTRIIDMATNEPFYLVRSESDDLTEYKVQYHKATIPQTKGYFTCSCPAGQEGFIHCSGPYCKHVRWSIEAAKVYKAEQKALAASKQREHLLIIGGVEADEETYNRVMNAKPYQWTEAEVRHDQHRYAPRPFSLLR